MPSKCPATLTLCLAFNRWNQDTFMANGRVAEAQLMYNQSAISCWYLTDHQKKELYSPLVAILSIKNWLKLDEHYVKTMPFENINIGYFAKWNNWPQAAHRIRQKSTLHIQFLAWQVHLFFSMITCFQDIAHFRIFPMTPMLKFDNDTKFLNLADCQEK